MDLFSQAGEDFEARFDEFMPLDKEFDASHELAKIARQVPAVAAELKRRAGESEWLA
jgi:hypothetical protein